MYGGLEVYVHLLGVFVIVLSQQLLQWLHYTLYYR